jgi:hypothetical protein
MFEQNRCTRGHILSFHRLPLSKKVGRNSPYGEQALVLLEALAKGQKLDTMAYAQLFADTFGGDWHIRCKGYRDASCKGGSRHASV